MNRFCSMCGEVVRDGKSATFAAIVCEKCVDSWYDHKGLRASRFCTYCGSEVFRYNGKRRHSRCLQCNIRLSSKRRNCSSLTRMFPQYVVKVYECNHDSKLHKETHHPDYNYPFLIATLCHHCHKQEHSRIERLRRAA